jgi:uncharacterized iron-regulated membrane protein
MTPTANKSGLLWRLLHRPQQTFVRKAVFQVHLWTGVLFALYMAMIGLTGSILVFRNEITARSYRTTMAQPSGPVAAPNLASVFAAVSKTNPQATIVAFRTPSRRDPVEIVYLREGKHNSVLLLDPHSLRPLGSTRPEPHWLQWTRSLHADLLTGKSGRLWNGAGAIALVLISLSGILIWWRGAASALRGLWFNPSLSWKRIFFDLHSMVGFWSLLFILMWAVTGIQFAWPKQYRAAISSVSRLEDFHPPRVVPQPAVKTRAPLSGIIAQAQRQYPDAVLTGADMPSGNAPTLVYMTEGTAGDLLHSNYLYFDPLTGRQLALWQRGHPKHLGDWISWVTVPLHFGNYWSLSIEILWFVAGLALPVLSITGLVMYWNRYLNKRLRRLAT